MVIFQACSSPSVFTPQSDGNHCSHTAGSTIVVLLADLLCLPRLAACWDKLEYKAFSSCECACRPPSLQGRRKRMTLKKLQALSQTLTLSQKMSLQQLSGQMQPSKKRRRHQGQRLLQQRYPQKGPEHACSNLQQMQQQGERQLRQLQFQQQLCCHLQP